MNQTITRNNNLLVKKYWQFFVPTLLMGVASNIAIIVDAIIVGNLLGEDALAAVNLCTPIVLLYAVISCGLGFGAASLISIAFGKRNRDYASEIFSICIWAMGIVSCILVLAQYIFQDAIVATLTADANLQPLVQEYFHHLIYGTPLLIMVYGLVFSLRSDGFVKLSTIIIVVQNAVNLALDLVYIGWFDMGIGGSSLATVSGSAVAALVLVSYFMSEKRNLVVRPQVIMQLALFSRELKGIIITGIPVAFNILLLMVKIFFCNLLANHLAGRDGVVAFSVCLQCMAFIGMFITGAAQTMNPIIGVLYGERDHYGIREIFVLSLKVVLCCGLISTFCFALFPEAILSLFGVTDVSILAIGITGIRLIAISLCGTCFTILFMYYYVATKHQILAFVLPLLQGCLVLLPAAYLLSHFFGIDGMWLAFTVAEASSLFVVFGYFFFTKWRASVRYNSVLLLEEDEEWNQKRLECTGQVCDKDEFPTAQLMEEVRSFLGRHGLAGRENAEISAAIEVFLTSIAQHAYPDQSGSLDIFVRVQGEEVIVDCRDAGNSFDMKEQLAEHLGGCVTPDDGVGVFSSCVIGFNCNRLVCAR